MVDITTRDLPPTPEGTPQSQLTLVVTEPGKPSASSDLGTVTGGCYRAENDMRYLLVTRCWSPLRET